MPAVPKLTNYFSSLQWIIFLAGCSLTACGMLPKAAPPTHAILFTRIDVEASPLANGGDPLTVDLVFVDDRDLLADLETRSAAMWRTYKAEYLQELQDKAFIYTLDIAPGQTLSLSDFPDGGQSAQALVIFAHYDDPGLHRRIVQYESQVQVYLQETDLVVVDE